ncbi:lysophospholipid acyltransferase family protein [Aliikangiella sp. IMCC44359]|uniref:lysophospholipid acyltransferase family protein n=1 Tax=Aliikangiella sp. IMCC44359 TaxID=3459125 RepID=UPI00403AB3A6
MLSWLSKQILTLSGWKIVGQPPALKKYLIIGAPHTSNWDFFIFILLKFHFQLKINFIGKHTIFVWPFNWFLRKLGGIPIDRSQSHNIVDSIVKSFEQNERMLLALAPEGTRSYKEHWKSGFYYIALNANVPVQTCFLDAKTRQLGFGPLIELTGDIEIDLSRLKAFYQSKMGINPEQSSKVTFKIHS